MLDRVQAEAAEGQIRGVRGSSGSAGDCPDPRQEFLHCKGLDQVVVRACVQPVDSVAHTVERGGDDDRSHDGFLPDGL